MAIKAWLYDANGHDTTLDIDQAPLSELRREQLLWVDIGNDDAEIATVATALGLGDEIRVQPDPSARPGIARGDGAVWIRAIGLRPDSAGIVTTPVEFFAKPGIVVSI